MLLSAVSVLVVAQSSSEVPEVFMNNPVYSYIMLYVVDDDDSGNYRGTVFELIATCHGLVKLYFCFPSSRTLDPIPSQLNAVRILLYRF